jgi:hypothetical protein
LPKENEGVRAGTVLVMKRQTNNRIVWMLLALLAGVVLVERTS